MQNLLINDLYDTYELVAPKLLINSGNDYPDFKDAFPEIESLVPVRDTYIGEGYALIKSDYGYHALCVVKEELKVNSDTNLQVAVGPFIPYIKATIGDGIFMFADSSFKLCVSDLLKSLEYEAYNFDNAQWDNPMELAIDSKFMKVNLVTNPLFEFKFNVYYSDLKQQGTITVNANGKWNGLDVLPATNLLYIVEMALNHQNEVRDVFISFAAHEPYDLEVDVVESPTAWRNQCGWIELGDRPRFLMGGYIYTFNDPHGRFVAWIQHYVTSIYWLRLDKQPKLCTDVYPRDTVSTIVMNRIDAADIFKAPTALTLAGIVDGTSSTELFSDKYQTVCVCCDDTRAVYAIQDGVQVLNDYGYVDDIDQLCAMLHDVLSKHIDTMTYAIMKSFPGIPVYGRHYNIGKYNDQFAIRIFRNEDVGLVIFEEEDGVVDLTAPKLLLGEEHLASYKELGTDVYDHFNFY